MNTVNRVGILPYLLGECDMPAGSARSMPLPVIIRSLLNSSSRVVNASGDYRTACLPECW